MVEVVTRSGDRVRSTVEPLTVDAQEKGHSIRIYQASSQRTWLEVLITSFP